jgi:hypothetical protein
MAKVEQLAGKVEETWPARPEQVLVFAREGQPANMQGFTQALIAQMEMHEAAVTTFKFGKGGRPWSDHSQVPVLRRRPVLPSRLPRQPGGGLNTGAR